MAKRTYNRRGRPTAKKPVTSDKGRKQRLKGAETERRTGSKDRVTRGRGVTRTRTGAPRGASGPANPPQQGPSRPTPTAIGGDTGRRGGPNQPARSGPPRPKTPTTPGRFVDKPQVKANVKALQSSLPAKMLKAGNKLAMVLTAAEAVKQALAKKPKKGTGKPMASMGSDYKAKEKKLSRAAGAANFDAAFAKARKAGKKTFTWRGKKYTTKMK